MPSPSMDRVPGPVRELMAVAAELRRIPHERRLAASRPPQTGLVVDVGAGHAPTPRANAIVDKYVTDDFERESVLAHGKALVVADGHALPFADRAIAYVVAAHVLEHATDPVRFAGELSRVADAGFVQTPTRLAEQTFGWPFHPWLIDREGDVLVFTPKPSGDAMTALHEVHKESALFRLFFFSRRSAFHHTIHWQDHLNVRVSGVSAAQQTAEFDLAPTLAALRNRQTPPLPPAVRAALRCPACRASLRETGEVLECSGCSRAYPVLGGVPVLLEEATV